MKKMKIMIISVFLPCPPDAGGKTRLFNILKNLEEKYEISFLYLYSKENNKEEIIKSSKQFPNIKFLSKKIFLKSSFKKFCYLFFKFIGVNYSYHKKTEKEIKQIIKQENPDFIQVEFTSTDRYLPNLKVNNSLVVHEIKFKRIERENNVNKFNILKFFKYLLLKKEEILALKKYNKIIAMSETDANYLRKYNNNITIVENGVDISLYQQSNKLKQKLYFIGHFDNIQNQDALKFFLNDIYDKLDFSFKMVVIGKKLSPKFIKELKKRKINYIEYLSFSRLKNEIQDSILIVPLRFGGGSRLKILEAFALGNPVISTSIGAEGIKVKNQKNILIVDNANDFASGVKRLFQDIDLQENLSKNARKLVENNYSWEIINKKQESVFKDY